MAKDNVRVEVKDNVELIQKLIEEKINEKNKASSDGSFVTDDHEDQRFLSTLLSQLESLKEENTPKLPETPTETNDAPSSSVVKVETKDETIRGSDGGSKEMGTDEIVKELRNLKRQNTITHWLLSIMIILTATWQLSEVKLILNVKNKLSDPLRSVRSMFTKVIKDGEPPLKIPELPHMDFHVLDSNGEDD